MNRGGHARIRRVTRAGLFARLRQPLFAWIAVFALFFQISLAANHGPSAASSADLAAASLSAALGQPVSLCVERSDDHSGAPDRPCCDDCAFCGAACHSGAVAPERVADPMAPVGLSSDHVAERINLPPLVATFFLAARPRAPPVLA
jgi:hypothetical protein